jgi:phospholipid/cholesterol/gamma-HCH transport system substrate-binding protein
METRANYAIIGMFTLAVIAAGFGFVYWFSGSDSGKGRQPVRIVFTGSIAGLSKGSGVLFNGIRVGDVSDVYFDKDQPEQAFAQIEVERDTPVRTDTKARLDVQLLSGAAVVALTGGDRNAAPLTPPPGQAVPTIVAERSDFASLLEQARGTARRADDLLEQVRGLVAENRPTIQATLNNVQSFSEALGRNAPSIDRALSSIGGAAEKIGPLAVKLEALADNVGGVVRAVDPKRVAAMVDNAAGVMETIGSNRPAINSLITDVASLGRRLNDTVPKLDQTLTGASNVLAGIDPVRLARIVDNADRFTAAIGNSSRDVEAALKNANSITEKVNRSADRIDGVLKAAENFLGSAAGQEGQSTFASIRLAAEAFRKASENLDRRATEIATGLTRFTGTGARQVEALGTDARRTVNDVGRAARNLERNPSSVIFGGSQSPLPQYNGR